MSSVVVCEMLADLEDLVGVPGTGVTEPLTRLLDDLCSLGDLEPPAPRGELALLLAGSPVALRRAAPPPVREPRPRSGRHTVAGLVAAAVSVLTLTGVAAVANELPPGMQRMVADFSERYLPFQVPRPSGDRPAHDPGDGTVDRMGEAAMRSGAAGTSRPDRGVPGSHTRAAVDHAPRENASSGTGTADVVGSGEAADVGTRPRTAGASDRGDDPSARREGPGAGRGASSRLGPRPSDPTPVRSGAGRGEDARVTSDPGDRGRASAQDQAEQTGSGRRPAPLAPTTPQPREASAAPAGGGPVGPPPAQTPAAGPTAGGTTAGGTTAGGTTAPGTTAPGDTIAECPSSAAVSPPSSAARTSASPR